MNMTQLMELVGADALKKDIDVTFVNPPAVDKLHAIFKDEAGTIEYWVPDTAVLLTQIEEEGDDPVDSFWLVLNEHYRQ